MTGTVSSVDPTSKTITMFLDSGSQGTFKDMINQKVSLAVDKKLLVDTTSPDEFKKGGAYVVVFYFGGSDTRTAVALRSLGTGPFTAMTGTVTQFENHRSLSIRDESGAVKSFALTGDTIVEAGAGAVSGAKFQASKGDHVRVVGAAKDGSSTALFVREM
ncbi:MAG TPA: hypothetical protein VHW46_08670 [Terracidiphilus sp.]|nr:hypothetical protein [Terracidiphilus sp.]